MLVDRSHGEEAKVWPVRYTMFHMANASGLFRTAAELANAGFYPVRGNHWRKGNESYLPLYQSRMIGQFDHRANAVRANPHNTHNPYLSEPVGEAQHRDLDSPHSPNTGCRQRQSAGQCRKNGSGRSRTAAPTVRPTSAR